VPHLCSLLPAKAVVAAACASRSWRQQLKDEHLWKDLCRQDWGLDVALWPNGGIHNSFRQARTYTRWLMLCVLTISPGRAGYVHRWISLPVLYCRETYLEWQRQFPLYGQLAPRACRVCTAIYSWYQRHVPEIAASFRYIKSLAAFHAKVPLKQARHCSAIFAFT
jgi:hypothetical protein